MKSGKVALIAVSTLLGVMLSVQYKSTQELKQTAMNMRAEDLYQQLMQVEKEKEDLEKTVNEFRKNGYEERIKLEIDNLRYRAGLTAVEGPGIVIMLNDSKQPLRTGENQNVYLVHDEDVLRIINELKAAGAEAISLNDQRIVAMTEIRCAGPTITVNGKMLAPPFQIKAIGDSHLLLSALQMRGGVADTLKYWGIELQMERKDLLQIPGYLGAIRSDFAKPIEGGKK